MTEETAKKEAGQKMQDGTFYLGRFKGKDGVEKDWFAAAEDAEDNKGKKRKKGKRLLLSFNDAAAYAKGSKAYGHDDWIVPPGHDDPNGEPDILGALFNNKAKIGGFDGTDLDPADWYWSSSKVLGIYGLCQRFSDGEQFHDFTPYKLSVRLVRSVAI